MSSEQVTMLIILNIKTGSEDKMREISAYLNESTNVSDKGCIYYAFHQQVDNPNIFVIFERWQDSNALQAHLARLQDVYGAPAPGELFPKPLLELIEKFDLMQLQVIA